MHLGNSYFHVSDINYFLVKNRFGSLPREEFGLQISSKWYKNPVNCLSGVRGGAWKRKRVIQQNLQSFSLGQDDTNCS